MPITIGQSPDHGFDEPLGLLSDCHRRIQHFLHVLVAVDAELAGGSLTAGHRSALDQSLQYFATSAPKHTDDEEESLFPRLRATGDPAAAEALGLLEGLEADHDEAESLHSAVDLLVRRWIADDGLVAAEAAHLREHLARLQAIYRRHIAIEDQDLFPAAARLLDASTIHEIGREMAARRKVASEAKGEPRR